MLCSTVQQLSIFHLQKDQYNAVPVKALLFISSIYSKTSFNNALTKDSFSESSIHKGSSGKILSFFLKANNSLSFSVRVLSLFHTSIISAPLILPYCNSVSIFFYWFFAFIKLFFKIFDYSIMVLHLMCKNLSSFPHLQSHYSLERSFKKVIKYVDVLLTSGIHFLSFNTHLKAISILPRFYPFSCSSVFPSKLFICSFSFKAVLVHLLFFVPSSFKRQNRQQSPLSPELLLYSQSKQVDNWGYHLASASQKC